MSGRHIGGRVQGRQRSAGGPMADGDVLLCVSALYENLQDGMIADKRFDSDFDKAEADLERSFREFLIRDGADG